MNSWSCPASRVTSVGGENCGYFAIASFSLWSRIARGSLNTFAPSSCASSRSQVLATYSVSNGGSLRMSTTSNSSSGVSFGDAIRYQGSLSPVRVSEAGSFADNPTSLPHEAFLQHEIQL